MSQDKSFLTISRHCSGLNFRNQNVQPLKDETITLPRNAVNQLPNSVVIAKKIEFLMYTAAKT
jgi:hypothetical protein